MLPKGMLPTGKLPVTFELSLKPYACVRVCTYVASLSHIHVHVGSIQVTKTARARMH